MRSRRAAVLGIEAEVEVEALEAPDGGRRRQACCQLAGHRHVLPCQGGRRSQHHRGGVTAGADGRLRLMILHAESLKGNPPKKQKA